MITGGGGAGGMEEESGELRVVMLPWLATGHIIPFFELAKRLALKGVHVSFFSTPGNILRLPPIPQSLTPLLDFVPRALLLNIDNTVDLPSESHRPLLNQAFAEFNPHLETFLSDPSRPKPDWIIYDAVASSWVPDLASRFGLSSAFFSLFNAPTLTFFRQATSYSSPEELTKIPASIPFPTTVAFRPFEARQIFPMLSNKSGSESGSGSGSGSGSYESETAPRMQLMLIRTCREFERKWIDLLVDAYIHRMPVIPIGFIPPSVNEEQESETWGRIREWLDRKEPRSVVYAAFGTEARLTGPQIDEIAIGLEMSGLAFLWAIRSGAPPEGFEERNVGRGLVWKGWVPQARLLAHRSVGGFLTHGGWNSVVEGLAVGVAMAVLPMVFDQGLNARHLVESGYAVEVERDSDDGHFSGEEIARKLRMVMVEDEGEEVRRRVRKGKEVFGSQELQEAYDLELVKQLWEKRKKGTICPPGKLC